LENSGWKNTALFIRYERIPENNDEDKNITRSLYGGNKETRIQQEIVLGIGGIRALHAIGTKPLVCHMNEGHSAFLALERMRYLIKYYGLTFEQAKSIGFYSNVFTTHTPVLQELMFFQMSWSKNISVNIIVMN
jgi:starch phosphorylase